MPNDVLSAALTELTAGRDLTQEDARAVLLEIMGGRAGEAQTAAFLSALRVKGETADEIVGMARAMTELAEKVDVDADVILDTCGTGGDAAGTFNISTAAALVAAAAGVTVAKHGNRSATSRCGSADVLEALGVAIDLAPEQVSRCIAACGIGFMFAPRHHLAMKHVAPVRRELGMATIFNLLGPLTNPAGARTSCIGVADVRYVDRIAQAVRMMGNDHILIVHSDDGLDEISTTCPTSRRRGLRRRAAQRYDGDAGALRDAAAQVRSDAQPAATRRRTPPCCAPSWTASGAGASASSIARRRRGPAHRGGCGSVAEGVEEARAAVASGAARAMLDALVATTPRLAQESC